MIFGILLIGAFACFLLGIFYAHLSRPHEPRPEPTVDELIDRAVAEVSEREWGEPTSPVMFKRGKTTVTMEISIRNPDNMIHELRATGFGATAKLALHFLLAGGFK